MVEIKRFYLTPDLKEKKGEPFIYYMSNNPQISLIHFLERELGEHLSLPSYLESAFAKDIITKGKQSRYFLNEFEGFLAVQIS